MPGEFSQQDVQRYRIAWNSYVLRRNVVVVLFVAFVPLGILIAKLKLGERGSFAMLVGWTVVYLTGAWWLTRWKCPRCGKVFANRLWSQRCISCGLSKDEVAEVRRGKS
ncbi:MAG: hypothetical protein WB660_17275 [Candidatus Sulfotelmatobacter sp.]